MEVTTLGNVASGDFSILSLLSQSDYITKAVLIMLLGASFWTWAIIFEKWFLLKQLKVQIRKFEERFWSGGSLDDLYDSVGIRPADPMSAIFVSAMKEWRRSNIAGEASGRGVSLQQRIERAMQITLDREVDRIEHHLMFLASTASVSPFLGLFGTVWGIINSFQAIGVTQNTSLAVIAPGMAEALFTTALGLVAAIPAVIGYNKLSTDIDRLARRLESFAGEFASILSRQIDEATRN